MKSPREGTAVKWVSNIVLSIFSALAVIPFWLLISSSITDQDTAISVGFKFIPAKVSLLAYTYLFQQWRMVLQAYGITILVTVAGTSISLLLVTMLAYGLTQSDVRGVKLIMFLVIFSILFNGGIVPTYYIYVNLLHIRNTIFALLLPNLLLNGFTVILTRNYIVQSIPNEIFEAAKMDGCGVFRICFKMVFPLSTPILATTGLMEGLAYWNDWTNGLYYITDEKYYTVQLMLNQINSTINFIANNSSLHVTSEALPAATVPMALAVVAILPILCIYPFFQKYFAKGIVMGSVKG